MALQLSHVAAPESTTATARSESARADERWAAWQAKGAAHDRAVRRKMVLAAPIAIAVIAVIVYALAGR